MSEDEVVCGRNCACCDFGDGTAPCDHDPHCPVFRDGSCDCNAEENAKNRKAEAEEESSSETINRLSDLLKATAEALRGPPPDLVMWSWADLPALASSLKDSFRHKAEKLVRKAFYEGRISATSVPHEPSPDWVKAIIDVAYGELTPIELAERGLVKTSLQAEGDHLELMKLEQQLFRLVGATGIPSTEAAMELSRIRQETAFWQEAANQSNAAMLKARHQLHSLVNTEKRHDQG